MKLRTRSVAGSMVAVGLVMMVGAAVGMPTAGARQPDDVGPAGEPGPPGGDNAKITICHRTDSDTNPYVVIEVATEAADGIAGNSGQSPDHFGEHQGPLWEPGLKDLKIEWGDIIPPIPGVHSGANWTDEGQAFYAYECRIPPPTGPTSTTTTSTSTTAAPSTTSTTTTSTTAAPTSTEATTTTSTTTTTASVSVSDASSEDRPTTTTVGSEVLAETEGPGSLAFSGSWSLLVLGLGAGLVAIGTVLVRNRI